MKIYLRIIIAVILFVCSPISYADAQIMSTYSWQPPVLADTSAPNTMILMSNDWTGFTRGYKDDNFYDTKFEYWGYFDANKFYKYVSQGATDQFQPVDWIAMAGSTASEEANHYVPAVASCTDCWSGNFLNWATMANVDFMRKALTGGRRVVPEAIGKSFLLRGLIEKGQAWKKNHSDLSDLQKSVPSAYADTLYEFYSIDHDLYVRNKNNTDIIAGPFRVEVSVCVDTIPEVNCKLYPAVKNYKPEGLLQEYGDKMRFALMTYSHNADPKDNKNKDNGDTKQGGILRKKMGFVTDEWVQNNGQQVSNTNDTMIPYIERFTRKGWDPLAEMYYDALRYFKGNTGASSAYCGPAGNIKTDDNFNVFGCDSGSDWGADPITDWCQKNNILILNDEYPSQEHDALPGSMFNPGYTVQTFAGGNANPYVVNVSNETKAVGDWELAHNTTSTSWYVGNILGGLSDGSCSSPKTVNNLAAAHGICPTEPGAGIKGTFYLAGLAHHAFVEDLRSGIDITDVDEHQNIRTWALAYRATPTNPYAPPVPPMNQLWLAAKYGNFKDLNGNGWPDTDEWERKDKNGNLVPYAYFAADNGRELQEKIGEIFDSILETTASSTAVSVLANSGQGEGNLVQAYYRPRISDAAISVDWLGFLQSLWVDEYGFIREDTIEDGILNHTEDKVVRYTDSSGTTKAALYAVTATDPFPDFEVDLPESVVEMEEVKVLWDAGRVLATTDPVDRKIFTFLDKNQDGIVEDTSTDVFDDSGEVIQFYDRNYRAIMPYLYVNNGSSDNYLGRSQKIRAFNLIRWTKGYDQEVNKNKFIDLTRLETRLRSLNGTDVYKLGDIINSTPVTVAAPPDNFHIIYSDATYADFYNKYTKADSNRETVVYAGANDGMLHAFTSWRFDADLSEFVDPDASSNNPIGSELWAYIPQNLLPHLKWLPKEGYSHVYYVDMQPRIFDARIFTSDADTSKTSKHPGGWGTILIGGFNLGGGMIEVTDKFDDGSNAGGTNYVTQTRTFNPSYFAIDITEPREPVLLWDRSYDQLGMSSSFPTIMRIGPDKGESDFSTNPGTWLLVFGSGPDAGDRTGLPPQYDGESFDPAYFYAVDIKTGVPYQSDDGTGLKDWLFKTTETNAFMGPPVSFDKNLNYNTDAAYIPVIYDNGTSANHDWAGSIYKITVPWKGPLYDANANGTDLDEKLQYGNLSIADYSNNPTDASYAWQMAKLFDSPRPTSAAPALSIDHLDNTWVYFGTGRLYQQTDGTNSDFGSIENEYLFGIKDPFFNRSYSGASPEYYLEYFDGGGNFLSKTITTTNIPSDLFDADPIIVLDTGMVYTLAGSTYTKYGTTGYWNEMVDDARTFDGWFRTLDVVVDANGEQRAMRSLNKPSVIGGLSLFSNYMPKGDACAFGGESALSILYYETGTAFKRAVARGGIGIKQVDVDGDGVKDNIVKDTISLGSGTTSSVGIHIGRQNDRFNDGGTDPEGDMITGFVQQGTGMVVEIDLETALKVRSGLRAWRER